MSQWNILVAITNLASVYPLLMCFKTSDYTTFCCVAFAEMSSFVSHLFMSHKHDMIGFGTNHNISKLLNNVDIFSVIVLMTRLFYIPNLFLFISHNYLDLMILFMLNIVSEKTNNQYLYIFSHNLWHMGAFLLLGEFLWFSSIVNKNKIM